MTEPKSPAFAVYLVTLIGKCICDSINRRWYRNSSKATEQVGLLQLHGVVPYQLISLPGLNNWAQLFASVILNVYHAGASWVKVYAPELIDVKYPKE